MNRIPLTFLWLPTACIIAIANLDLGLWAGHHAPLASYLYLNLQPGDRPQLDQFEVCSRQTKTIMPAINLQTNPAPQGLRLFLFAFVNISLLFSGAQRKGIRKISSVNSESRMSGANGW